MKTLTAFALMVRKHLPVLQLAEHQVHVFMESGQVIKGGGKLSEYGYHLADFRYCVVLQIDQMPAVNGGVLLAALETFLAGLDSEESLSPLQLDITAVSDRLIDVDASVQVSDAIYIQPDDKGRIHSPNGRFDFKHDPFSYAENLDSVLVDAKD